MWVARSTYEELVAKVASQAALLRCLEDHLAFVTALHAGEKQRADTVTDTLLLTKGLPPVTPPAGVPPPEDLFTESPLEVEKMLKLIERVGVTQALEESTHG